MNDNKQSRETIGSRLGFLMLAAGCAIGLGNVWRFPFVTGAHGGAIFVGFYLLFLLILGFPVMVMELALGRAAKSGLYGAVSKLPDCKFNGWKFPAGLAFCGNLVLMMMYTTVCGWMLAYAWFYANGSILSAGTAEATGKFFGEFIASPSQNVGAMLVTVLIGTVVCASGLRNGVERITKILMSGLFLLLFGLAIYTLTLPGAGKGMHFYLAPNVAALKGNGLLTAISAAMSQAFFTLSLGVGSIAIFGSYIEKDRSLTGESLLIILLDTIVALLAGVVIFAACFNYDVSVSGGPGLVLVSLPNVFNHMTGGRIVGLLFFLFMSIAALTTVIAVFENLIAFLIDQCHLSRIKAAAVNGVLLAILSLPCALGFNVWSKVQPLGKGSCILDFEDWLVSDNLLPLGAFMIALFCTLPIGWGWKKFIAEADSGKGLKFPVFAKYYVIIGVPLLILALFGLGVYQRFFAN